MARVQKFYKSVFDWGLTPLPAVCPDTGKVLDEPMVVLIKAGAAEGSFIKVTEEDHLSAARGSIKSKYSVRVTITVDSIDETLKLINEAGGEVYEPKSKIPGGSMGHIAFFLDTEKNVMGLWSWK
ncbi:hypothetical protein FRB94_007959 [Tulasnella sp. JGI-2019a]|nr:hypothetical protein FRB94_007959 [Tulasnella sp. JGI-2019a]